MTAQVTGTVTGQCGIVSILVFHTVTQELESDFLGKIDICLSCCTTFGSHLNNTVGTPHTINCSSGSIFQHRNAFNGERIKERKVTLHVIHDNQRGTGIGIHGADTTDIHGGFRPTRFARPFVSFYTRQSRRKSILKHCDRIFLQQFPRNGRSGFCHKLLLFGTKTYSHFVSIFINILFHLYLKTIQGSCCRSIFIPYTSDANFVTVLYILQAKITVGVRQGDTALFSYIHDGTYNAVTFGIHNAPIQHTRLLGVRKSGYHHQGCRQQGTPCVRQFRCHIVYVDTHIRFFLRLPTKGYSQPGLFSIFVFQYSASGIG